MVPETAMWLAANVAGEAGKQGSSPPRVTTVGRTCPTSRNGSPTRSHWRRSYGELESFASQTHIHKVLAFCLHFAGASLLLKVINY